MEFEKYRVTFSQPKTQGVYKYLDGKFLRGPIPWDWISKTGKLPGQALHVGIVIWLLKGIQKSNTVKIEKSHLRELGVSHASYYRGLKHLEEAKLITVTRGQGKSSIVTIVGTES